VGNLADARFMNKDCRVTGFPRIFTEHATGGGEHASNPNHVVEIRSALKMDCDGSAPLDFTPFMGAAEGLRHTLPSSAESCISTRTLSGRFRGGQYQFKQAKGSGCGNFGIIEICHIHKESVRAKGGRHATIARITADGAATHTNKLYTLLEGTTADAWMASVLGGHTDLQVDLPDPA
jgi:hypothetical protein